MIEIRLAKRDDIPGMLHLIQELAEYEKAPEAVIVSRQDMQQYFDENRFEAFVASEADDNDNIVGMALFYWTYSTWKGKIVYLDDLVVTQSQRRNGIGESLFDTLINYCKVHGANQLRWHVLDWNHPAISFYKKLNADLDEEWITCKLEKDRLS